MMSKRKLKCNYNNLSHYWNMVKNEEEVKEEVKEEEKEGEKVVEEEEVEKKEKVKEEKENEKKKIEIQLGDGSEVLYFSRLIDDPKVSWNLFEYLCSDDNIPWSRPTIRVFGRCCLQPRDTCYVATPGLTPLTYSGYTPPCYPWHHFPPLMDLLLQVQNAIPGSRFNSLLLNRYNGGNDYVGWHSDNESLYGPTPLIASLSLGFERPFLLKKKTPKHQHPGDEPSSKRMKSSNRVNQHSFTLKHGSLLVMRGFTQRDWIHSVPKRAKVEGVRINLTFRLVL